MKTSPKEKSTPSVVQKKIIPGKRSDVFDAWTQPEIMEQWFLPAKNWKSKCAIEARQGGRWSNEMIDVDGSWKNGKKNAPGTSNMHSGEYLEFKRPERLVFTWNTPFVPNTTRVTVELKDLGDKTELTLTHELLETDDLRQAHSQGWATCLSNLTAYFSK